MVSGGVWIEFAADTAKFEKALKTMQSTVRINGEALGDSFGATFAKSVKPALRDLQREFATAFNNIKVSKIELPDEIVRSFAQNLNMSTEAYKKLAEKMVNNSAFQKAEKALKNIQLVHNVVE
ncbi:MAG: hypothetical protein LBD73_09210 [Deferribacteraceae bacterium]|jgi:diketogulonate reductase-like aldo/keto reductase|nr:hypothetical protein [Deferribacteraceae bacterium]